MLLVRHRFPGKRHLQRAHRPAARGVAGRRRARARSSSTGRFDADRRLARRHGIQVIFALPGHGDRHDVRVAAAASSARSCPVLEEIGTEQEQAACTLGASALPDVPPRHAARDPVGARLRHRAHPRPLPRRVRRGRRRVRQRASARPRPLTLLRRAPSSRTSTQLGRLRGRVRAGPHRDHRPAPASTCCDRRNTV